MKKIISIVLVVIIFAFSSCSNKSQISKIQNKLEKEGFTVTLSAQEDLKSLLKTLETVYNIDFQGEITGHLTSEGKYMSAPCIVEAIEFENEEDMTLYYEIISPRVGKQMILVKEKTVIMASVPGILEKLK